MQSPLGYPEQATIPNVPRPRSVRFTDEDLELLSRLQRRLNRTQRDVINLGLRHLWWTLEREERVFLDAPRLPKREREEEDEE